MLPNPSCELKGLELQTPSHWISQTVLTTEISMLMLCQPHRTSLDCTLEMLVVVVQSRVQSRFVLTFPHWQVFPGLETNTPYEISHLWIGWLVLHVLTCKLVHQTDLAFDLVTSITVEMMNIAKYKHRLDHSINVLQNCAAYACAYSPTPLCAVYACAY